MITIYCQYSYGGFKNFFIEGNENELVDKEVSDEDSFSFPDHAWKYFQYGGFKMIYRYFDLDKLVLVVKDIPSIHKDGNGRSIPCALQFVGDSSDRMLLDNMAVGIATDLNGFSNFFANLFYIQRDGLHIKGNELRKFIKLVGDGVEMSQTLPAQLNNIRQRGSGVLFFVPTSDKFGKDRAVTDKVCNELAIKINEISNNYMPLSSLKTYQTEVDYSAVVNTENNVIVNSDLQTHQETNEDTATNNTKSNDVVDKLKDLAATIKDLHNDQMQKVKGFVTEVSKSHIETAVSEFVKQNSELGETVKTLQEEVSALQTELKNSRGANSSLQNQIEIRDRKLSFQKKVISALSVVAGLLLVSLIGHCACNGEKKGEQPTREQTETIQATDTLTNN